MNACLDAVVVVAPNSCRECRYPLIRGDVAYVDVVTDDTYCTHCAEER